MWSQTYTLRCPHELRYRHFQITGSKRFGLAVMWYMKAFSHKFPDNNPYFQTSPSHVFKSTCPRSPKSLAFSWLSVTQSWIVPSPVARSTAGCMCDAMVCRIPRISLLITKEARLRLSRRSMRAISIYAEAIASMISLCVGPGLLLLLIFTRRRVEDRRRCVWRLEICLHSMPSDLSS